MRKVAVAGIILFLGIGFVAADEFNALITKVDGNKITFHRVKKGEKGDEITMTAIEKVKVVKGKTNPETKKSEAGDPIDGGLKNELFTKGGKDGKGVNVRIITDADNKNITEIRVTGGKKKDAK
ncbi:MAG: hypothetical protein L0215_10165 [Gemmataceae bacterium]|nr:hypothetical protein [Gemmataceae bacterium]